MFYLKILFANTLDKVIELSDRYVFHGELEKIIEVTYSYREIDDGFLLNETLFEEYTGVTYPEQTIDFLWRKYRYKIQVQLIFIEEILKKTARVKVYSRSEWLRKGIFVDALEYVKTILEISLEWLDFELRKAWIDPKLSKEKIHKKIEQIEFRESLAFGPKVIENQEEFSFCYNFIVNNHESKKNSLSEKDKKSMKLYLKNIKHASKNEILETPDIKKKILKGSFLKSEIPRKDYRKIFDLVCELYGVPQRTKITNAWSIYDGDNFLEIPRDTAFDYFTVERLLKLLTHEIESHYINSYNGKKLLGNFRGSKNLPKEEWLAMFMEKIFHGYTYENIDNIVEYFFTIMAGESLDGEMFEDFMRIIGKEYKMKKHFKNSVIRSKRNYPPEFPGVQHKDTVYFRGLTETIDYLREGWEFRKLFLGKVWFHDIDNLFFIYENYQEKESIIYPIFISDLIYYYLVEQEKNKDFIFDTVEYYLYLKKKYWFLDLDSFKIIERVNNNWKKILKIIKLIEKATTEL